MSQGYEMQKHRADILKGALDLAHQRLDAEKARVAELEILARHAVRRDIYDASQARVAELEKSLADWKARAGRMALRAKPMFDRPGGRWP
jgi:hypothetical protein